MPKQKQQIDEMKSLVTQHLLAGLKDGKPPRASFLNACISWVKANDSDLGVATAEEIRESLEAVGKSVLGLPEGTRLPFRSKPTLAGDEDDDAEF